MANAARVNPTTWTRACKERGGTDDRYKRSRIDDLVRN